MNLLRGDFFTCDTPERFTAVSDGFLRFAGDGTIVSLTPDRPAGSEQDFFYDFRGKLVIPAFCDLHLHAAQFPNAGLGYDCTFEEWLARYTYPAERAYARPAIYRDVNRRLLDTLWRMGVMSAVIMGSTAAEPIYDLLCLAAESGMQITAGKMNSDLGAYGPPAETTADSLRQTEQLIRDSESLAPLVRYCICPEFVPCCSDELMRGLGGLARRFRVPIETHHAEGAGDVELTRRRFPNITYAEVYRRFGLLGDTPAVMVHSIASTEDELTLFAETPTIVAHCPMALGNIPADRSFYATHFLEQGVRMGLGSDVGGGHTLNPMAQIVAAIQYSNLVAKPGNRLSFLAAFWMATAGGGAFFPRTGSLVPGHLFHGLVIDDSPLRAGSMHSSPLDRLQKFIYSSDPERIVARFCAGKPVRRPVAG